MEPVKKKSYIKKLCDREFFLHGHKMTEENTGYCNGYALCKICRKISSKKCKPPSRSRKPTEKELALLKLVEGV